MTANNPPALVVHHSRNAVLISLKDCQNGRNTNRKLAVVDY